MQIYTYFLDFDDISVKKGFVLCPCCPDFVIGIRLSIRVKLLPLQSLSD